MTRDLLLGVLIALLVLILVQKNGILSVMG